MTGAHFATLTPRFQRIALDACANMDRLCWADRLFFLCAAGDKHEVWRKAYATRHMTEQVPEWGRIVSAIIETWGAAEIDRFEMAAAYALSDDPDWRMAAEIWCVSHGRREALTAFLADPLGVSEKLVGHLLERLDQMAS